MAAGHPFPQREGTRLARSPQPGWSPVRSKRTGDAKGCVQPFATLCNLPSSSLSLSLPFPAPRNAASTCNYKRWIRSYFRGAIGLHLHTNRRRAKRLLSGEREREREREREKEQVSVGSALMNGRCRATATIYSMTATTATMRSIPKRNDASRSIA